MFWPTFTCQILIKFSFWESLWHKETDCTNFARKKLQIFCKPPVKRNLHIFSFSWLKFRLFKILQNFLHIWNGMVKGFLKMYNFSFFGQHFYYITGFCDTKFNFCKFANFLQILKVEHKSFPMMYHLSYLDIKHKIDPPSISWFSSTPAEIGLKKALHLNCGMIYLFITWTYHIYFTSKYTLLHIHSLTLRNLNGIWFRMSVFVLFTVVGYDMKTTFDLNLI